MLDGISVMLPGDELREARTSCAEVHTAPEPASVMHLCENSVKCGRGRGGKEEGSATLKHFLAGRVQKLTGKEGMTERLAAWATPGPWVPRFAVSFLPI